MGRASTLIGLALAAGCGSGTHATVDAITPPPDAGIDADLVDFSVTATYLDWDSTAAHPCPIAGATWTAHYDNTRTAVTGATGTFTIRLAVYLWLLDLQQPTAPSSCASSPGSYTIGANAIITPAVYYAGGHFVMRSLTDARAAAFAFDPARGNLLVHVDGPAREVAISSASAPAQAFDGSAWTAGATGQDVFFPNIDLTDTTMPAVSVSGGAVGTGSIPLAAGTLTYMTVIPN